MAKRQALHLLALPCTGQQDLRRQGAVFTHTEIVQSGSRTVAVGSHNRRAERYGARSILSPTVLAWGKSKAVTATARKIAVLFYNTLRHGMSYSDPGADQYEQQYRSRVLANLRRRAKSLGFVLQAIPGDAKFLRKAAAFFAKEAT